MKKIGRLEINSERLMKNEDLMILRGGYGGSCCWCMDRDMNIMGAMAASNPQDCTNSCWLMYWFGWWDTSECPV